MQTECECHRDTFKVLPALLLRIILQNFRASPSALISKRDNHIFMCFLLSSDLLLWWPVMKQDVYCTINTHKKCLFNMDYYSPCMYSLYVHQRCFKELCILLRGFCIDIVTCIRKLKMSSFHIQS